MNPDFEGITNFFRSGVGVNCKVAKGAVCQNFGVLQYNCPHCVDEKRGALYMLWYLVWVLLGKNSPRYMQLSATSLKRIPRKDKLNTLFSLNTQPLIKSLGLGWENISNKIKSSCQLFWGPTVHCFTCQKDQQLNTTVGGLSKPLLTLKGTP